MPVVYYHTTPDAVRQSVLCDDVIEFVDEHHQENVFHNKDGGYCNCWRNHIVEDFLVPKLEVLLSHSK
jgi:hypothetical protein